MHQQAFFFDNTRCTGCKTCVIACKDYKDLPTDYAYRHVHDIEGGDWVINDDGTVTTDAWTYHVSVACNHCGSPACTKVCPTGAMHKEPATGLVLVDIDKCIGCGYCKLACPYNAPHVDREKGHSVKCDGCRDRLLEGKKPQCVAACPLRALDFENFSDAIKIEGGEPADIAPLPPIDYTYPFFYVKKSSVARPAGDPSVKIANPKEVQ